MLIRRENLNDIFDIYQNVFDKSIVVALPNYKFFILKNKIIKELSLDEVASLLGVDYSVIYNEYQDLFNLKVEEVVEESSSEAEETSTEKEKKNGKRNS